MMRSFIALVLLLSLTGCQLVHRIRGEDTVKTDAEPFSDVILRYATELKYEKNLKLEDSEVCYENGKVKTVRLDFSSQDIIDLCEARFFLVDLVEEFIQRLNRSRDSAGQMTAGHFTPSDLEIYIEYESNYVNFVDTAYIGWIRLKDGVSVFYAGDINVFRQESWHSRQELYSESLQFVTIMRDAEAEYEATHPKKANRSFFGDHDFTDTSWFSGKSSGKYSQFRSPQKTAPSRY